MRRAVVCDSAPLVLTVRCRTAANTVTTERPVADRDLRRDGEASRLQVDQQLAPALRSFPHAHLEADQFLAALGRGADDDQHAGGAVLHARLEINTVRPNVDVAPGREIAALSAIIFAGPFLLEPPEHRRRKVGRVPFDCACLSGMV